MSTKKSAAVLPSMGLLLACVAGCGSGAYKMAAVKGTVMCQGNPVAGGVIKFLPIDAPDKTGRKRGYPGGASQATIKDDGTFSLMPIDMAEGAGALVGPHQVLFELPPTTRPRLTADDRSMMSPDEIKKWEVELSQRPVYPPCPCRPDITPAEVEVQATGNSFAFTLAPK